MNSDKKKDKAPAKACLFAQPGGVTFARGGTGLKENRFRIIAYSGDVIPKHWFWGNLVFDLQGVWFAKKVTPVLENHNRENRLGFTDKQQTIGKVIVEGKFLSNPAAQQIKSDMAEGFPMQASLCLPPDKIEYVKEGDQVVVNGRILKGPGAVFRKGKIQEVSMCVIGADKNAKSEAFGAGGKEIQFGVVDAESEDFGDDEVDEVSEEEDREMRYRNEIFSISPGDPGFAIEQITQGKTVYEAKKAWALLQQKREREADEAKTPEARYAEEFNASSDVQAEFGGAEGLKNYVAFRKAEDAGWTSVGKRKSLRFTASDFEGEETCEQKARREKDVKVEKYTAEFNASAEIQAEFGAEGLKYYVAFRKAEDAGQVRMASARKK